MLGNEKLARDDVAFAAKQFGRGDGESLQHGDDVDFEMRTVKKKLGNFVSLSRSRAQLRERGFGSHQPHPAKSTSDDVHVLTYVRPLVV